MCWKLWIIPAAAVVAGTAIALPVSAAITPRIAGWVTAQPDWVSAGQNNHNTRYAATKHIINAGNVSELKPKWTFTTAGDVSATATVANGVAYVPDWGGKLWAVDTKTSKAVWSHNVSDYTGVSSKTEHVNITPAFRGSVEALDARTGKILWKTYLVPKGFNGVAVWSSQPVVDHKTGMLYVDTGNNDKFYAFSLNGR